MSKRLYIILLLFSICSAALSQNSTLTGRVLSEDSRPLENVNILLFPVDSDDSKVLFTISNQEGNFTVKIDSKIDYRLEVSYLGYKKIVKAINKENALLGDVIMGRVDEELDEVVLTARLPLVIKEDTIKYNVKSFITGREKKLKEALNKLPGIEVDRDGTIKSNGEIIKQVLVDGKTFFTGDSKLAVNNIPVDVVDGIEVINNHNDIELLNDVTDTNKKVLNVVLKEGKKKFFFGDINAQGNFKVDYKINPSIYRYAPKNTISIITDINNIGESSFSLKDYFAFEGGILEVMQKNQFANNEDISDILSFIPSGDFLSKEQYFLGFDYKEELRTNWRFSTFGIFNTTEQINNSLSTFDYNSDELTREFRDLNRLSNSKRYIQKISFNKKQKKDEFLINTVIKYDNIQSNESILSQSNSDTIGAITNKKLINLKTSTNLYYVSKISQKTKLNLNGRFSYKNYNNESKYSTERPLFPEIAPSDASLNTFNYINEDTNNELRLNTEATIYHRTLPSHLIEISAGFLNKLQKYDVLLNESTEENSGIDVRTNLRAQNYFSSIDYKIKKSNFLIQAGLLFNIYNLRFSNSNTNQFTSLLPRLNLEYKFNDSHDIVVNFKRTFHPIDINTTYSGFLLQNFNSIAQGNQNLRPEVYNHADIRYKRFNIYNNYYYSFRLLYKINDVTVKPSQDISGINIINSWENIFENEQEVTLSFEAKKRVNNIRLGIYGRSFYRELYRNVNSNLNLSINRGLAIKPEISTLFENLPKLKIAYETKLNFFNSSSIENRTFETRTWFGELSHTFYDLIDINLDIECRSFEGISNSNTENTLLGNFKVNVQTKESPWSIYLRGTNLFNVNRRTTSRTSPIFVNDNIILLQPRIITLGASYNF